MLKAVPPLDTLYQAGLVPVATVADKVTVPEPHLLAPVAVGAAGIGLMVAVTAVEVNDTHPVVVFLALTK